MTGRGVTAHGNHLTLVSLRDYEVATFMDVVYAWEDALLALLPDSSIMTLGRARYRFDSLLRRRFLGQILVRLDLRRRLRRCAAMTTPSDTLLTCISSFQGQYSEFLRPHGRLVVHVIDCWEKDARRAAALAERVDLLLLGSTDSVEMVRARLPESLRGRIQTFPVFLDEKRYPSAAPEKTVDIVQIGRKDLRLHEWALRYSAATGASYVYLKSDPRGFYYLEDRPWEGEDYQLSYSSLVDLLSKARVSIVSPPDLTSAARCGAISPLTPRYLEAALCYAMPVGCTPKSKEYAFEFPPGFTHSVDSYEDFCAACDGLLAPSADNSALLERNRAYVLAHHTPAARLKQLRTLLESL